MFKKLLLTISVNAFALFLVQFFIGSDKFLITANFPIIAYICVGISMGILNFIVKPLLSLLTLPLVFITFGLFLSIINMCILYTNEYLFSEIFTPEIIGITFTISGGWMTYLIASLFLSFFNSILHFIIRK